MSDQAGRSSHRTLTQDDILASKQELKAARKQLLNRSADVTAVLHPKNVFKRWRSRNIKHAATLAFRGKEKLRDNTGLLTTIGIGGLLYLFRKPLWTTYKKLLEQKDNAHEQVD